MDTHFIVFRSLLKDIFAFVKREEGANFLQLLYKKDERVTQIDRYHRQLDLVIKAFHVIFLHYVFTTKLIQIFI